MATKDGAIEMALSNGYVFTNCSNDDMLIRTFDATQNIHIGTLSNDRSAVVVSGSNISLGGLVGIGTTTPAYTVDVIGNINYTGNLYQNGCNIGNWVQSADTLVTSCNALIGSNLEVSGNLTIRGTTTTVDSTTVNIVDNIIRLNNGAAFSSSLQAGIEVNRGAGYSNYYFIFDENSDYFKIGMSGGLQTVATRDDTLGSNSIAIYDAGGYKYTGCNDLVYSDGHLGVGISNPSYRLHVNTGAMIQGAFANTSYAAHGRMYFNDRNYGIGAGTFTGSTYDHLYMWRFDGVNRSIVFCRTSNGNTNPSTYIVDMIIYGNTGNVGIGLSNPAYKLDVVGDINYTGNLRQNGNLFTGSQWATNSSNLYILSSNVGIGLSNPAYKLDVVGDINYTGNLRQNGNLFTGSQWATNSSNLYILSSNVGIGLSNPAYTLDVNGTINATDMRVGNSVNINSTEYGDGIVFNGTGSNMRFFYQTIGTSGLMIHMDTAEKFHFASTGSVYLMTVLGTGNIGVNTTTPSERFQVAGKVYATTQLLGNSNDSVSVPSFAFKEDSNTGMYHAGTSVLGFVTGGAERMRIDSSGNIGIGTTTPSGYRLDVAGLTRIQNILSMNNQSQNCMISLWGDSNTASSINFYGFGIAASTLRYQVPTYTANTNHVFYGSNIELLRINGDGKVGIATTSPTEALEITGKVYTSVQVLGQSNDSVSVPSFAFKQDSNTGMYHAGTSALGFVTGGAERFRVNSNGVGIGTTSPSTTLDVNGVVMVRNGNAANVTTANQIVFGWAGTDTYRHAIKSRHLASSNDINNAIDFYVWQTTDAITTVGTKHAMSVTSTGVGIGTAAPSNTLDIMGSMRISSNITTSGSLLFTNSSGSSAFGIRPDSAVYLSAVAPYMASSSDNNALPGTGSNARPLYFYGSNITYDARFGNHNFNSGNVGVGTAAPSYKLHVVGDIYATADVIAYSDCNIKTDLQRIENAMAKLECINGYTYKRKDIDDSRRYAGLIAQEVEKVLPEVVHKDLDNRLSIAYGNMSSLIIEAIKELRGEVLAIKRHIGLL